MDKYLTRTYDRKPMKVKKNKQKKMRQSTLHACKKVVIIENVAELKNELDEIAKVLLKIKKINNTNTNNKMEKSSSSQSSSSSSSSTITPVANNTTTNTTVNDKKEQQFVKRANNIFDELAEAFISLETLEKTGLGVTVNLFAKKKNKHKYDSLRQKSTKLVKKWKATVEEGSNRRKRQEKVRKPVVASSTTSTHYNMNNNTYTNRMIDHRRNSRNINNNNSYNNRYRNSSQSLDFRTYRPSSSLNHRNNNNATNRFLQNNYQHVIEKKRTSRDSESIQHQRSNKKFKTTTTNLTIEQRERIRYNKEMALKKLQAKQRKQQQYRL